MPAKKSDAHADIEALHQRVDEQVHALLEKLEADLACRLGCSACCRDGISVFGVEAERIVREAGSVLRGEAHAEGACAFSSEEQTCRIYDVRPYVCRTQGLALRWLDEVDGAWVEYRDICALNEASIDTLALDASQCWSIGEVEGELATLQIRHVGSLRRVALRDLFVRD